MYSVTVLYPNTPGSHFDFAYYRDRHVPMMLHLLGDNVITHELRRGLRQLDGSAAPYQCVLNTRVHCLERFAAVMQEHAEQALGDVPNYTNVSPLIQLDEVLTG